MSVDAPVVLVPGGAGNVGEGIVRAFLDRGARVAVPSRSRERLDALAARVREDHRSRFLPIAGDVGTPEGAAAVAGAVAAHGPVTCVVAALGGWWQGLPLIDVPLDTFRRVLDDVLVAHFVVARTFLPGMARGQGGTYIFINGFSAEDPYPLAGPVSAAAAAQLMLGRVLMRELEGTAVRVHELVLGPVMSRSRSRGAPQWISAADVGALAAALAQAGERVPSQVFRVMDRDALRQAYATGGLEVPA
jgi:NAD(P)-dependent dehydrogenase (short-subunit alcohol dehydrogenase family)